MGNTKSDFITYVLTMLLITYTKLIFYSARYTVMLCVQHNIHITYLTQIWAMQVIWPSRHCEGSLAKIR